mmetsp:Transcript_16871/g.38964  ORF Transcript_16871/g.38964 Transcript_16871/m.38964 type:complete len:255 (+) Transcript_16871:973-1737(+)
MTPTPSSFLLYAMTVASALCSWVAFADARSSSSASCAFSSSRSPTRDFRSSRSLVASRSSSSDVMSSSWRFARRSCRSSTKARSLDWDLAASSRASVICDFWVASSRFASISSCSRASASLDRLLWFAPKSVSPLSSSFPEAPSPVSPASSEKIISGSSSSLNSSSLSISRSAYSSKRCRLDSMMPFIWTCDVPDMLMIRPMMSDFWGHVTATAATNSTSGSMDLASPVRAMLPMFDETSRKDSGASFERSSWQ